MSLCVNFAGRSLMTDEFLHEVGKVQSQPTFTRADNSSHVKLGRSTVDVNYSTVLSHH